MMDMLIALKDNQSLERIELPKEWRTTLLDTATVLDSRVVFKGNFPPVNPPRPMNIQSCIYRAW